MEATGSVAQLADRWTFVWTAPALALGLLVIVAGAVWWLRSTLGKSEVKGLKAQIFAAQEMAKTLEQHLSIAREQEQEAVATGRQLEAQIAELQREVLFSPEKVRARVEVLANTVTGMKADLNALATTLGHPPMEESPNPTDTEAST
jgi:hypothetical protein